VATDDRPAPPADAAPADASPVPGNEAAAVAVAPAPAPAPSAPAAAPAAPAPAATPAPAMQLAERIAPLGKGPDGVHRLTIHLNPEHLGPISVTAEVRGGDIHLHLAGATDAGREALRAALPDLKKELLGSGLGSCSMDLAHDAPGGGGAPDREARQPQPGAGRDADTGRERPQPRPETRQAVRRTSGGTGLDVHA
jgi:flagellar hook-length control protein FliK